MPRAGLSYRGKAPSSYNLSVSLRSTAPLVGEPLAKPFTLRGLPKPLPLGEVALRSNDGEGKPGRKEAQAQRWAGSLSERYYRGAEQFGSGLALSVSSPAPRQLPQRGSHWHVGQPSSGRAKHNISETAVLRCLGQRQLDKERCPEAAVPASKARPLASCRASGVQWKVIRPAKASPFGRGGIAKQ